MKKKIVLPIILVALMAAGGAYAGLKPGLARDFKGYIYREDGHLLTSAFAEDMYFDETGHAVEDGFIQVEGDTYLIDRYHVQEGIVSKDGNSYFLGDDGVLRTGFIECDSGKMVKQKLLTPSTDGGNLKTGTVTLYADKDGILQNGFFEIDGVKYHADSYMLSDGFFIDGEKTYYAEKGIIKTGRAEIGKEEYIFAESGELMKGLILDGGKYYYGAEDGHLLKSEFVKNRTSYSYFKEDGTRASYEFLQIDGRTYFFTLDGETLAARQNLFNGTYFFSAEGYIQSGWHDGRYFGEDGKMVTGFYKIDDRTYYFDDDGKRLPAGRQQIDGKTYFIADEGYYLTGWQDGSYFDAFGEMATGFYTIQGYTYYFTPDGYTLSGEQYIGDYLYCLSDDGYVLTGWQNGKYFTSDGPVANGIIYMDGKECVFDNGVQIYNQWYGNYYVKADGTVARSEFASGGYFWSDGTFSDLSSDGSYGRVFIPDGGYTAQLYYAGGATAYDAQSYVDWWDSAAYLGWFPVGVIADHSNQGFNCIKYATPGVTHLYFLDDGQITRDYVCGFIDYGGENTGHDLILSSGTSLFNSSAADLWTYTCNSNWTSITIVGWYLQ